MSLSDSDGESTALKGVWHKCVKTIDAKVCGGELLFLRSYRQTDTCRLVRRICKVCGKRYNVYEDVP